MVELQRSPEPSELTTFRDDHPGDYVAHFESHAFRPIKARMKALLNQDQGGLCAYCEQKLLPESGQVEHVLPKRGPYGRPDLALSYDNWVQGCIHPKHCGQKKADNLLPIVPGPGCNAHFVLLDDGSIDPIAGLTPEQKGKAAETLSVLGLNHADLKQDRSQWVNNLKKIMKDSPEELAEFLLGKPFFYILQTYAGIRTASLGQ